MGRDFTHIWRIQKQNFIKKGEKKKKKKAGRGIGIWLIWIAVVIAIFMLVVKPIFTEYYGNFYSDLVVERNELYTQVDSLKGDFNSVYTMRNAEIVNSEEPVVILESGKFTLEVKFNQDRTEVLSIEETRGIQTSFWIIAAVVVATLLYIAYSVGKLRKSRQLLNGSKEIKSA